MKNRKTVDDTDRWANEEEEEGRIRDVTISMYLLGDVAATTAAAVGGGDDDEIELGSLSERGGGSILRSNVFFMTDLWHQSKEGGAEGWASCWGQAVVEMLMATMYKSLAR